MQMHRCADSIVLLPQGLPDQWNALLKGSKITAEDAAKNPQAVLEALEFYTEQTRREKEAYREESWSEKPLSAREEAKPHPSRSTPAPRHVRPPPTRPARPPLPTNQVKTKASEKDVQALMDSLKVQV